MSFVCKRTSLLKALSAVQPAVAARAVQEVLRNVLIAPAGSKKLKISATDLDIAITCPVSVQQCDMTESLLLPAVQFLSMLREADGDTVTVNLEGEHAKVSSGRATFSLNTADVEMFPPIEGFPQKKSAQVEIPVDRFVEMVQMTAFAVTTEEARYAISGVQLDVEGSKVSMAATDGRRLAISEVPRKKKGGGKESAILSAKFLTGLARAISAVAGGDGGKAREEKEEKAKKKGKKKENVELVIQEKNVVGRAGGAGGIVVVARRIEGTFPPYRDVVPQNNKIKATVDKAKFASAVRLAAEVTMTGSRSVVLEFEGKTLAIRASSSEVGSAVATLDTESAVEPVTIRFNPDLLLDVAKVLRDDNITLEMGGGESPVLVRERKDYLHVLMPLKSSGE